MTIRAIEHVGITVPDMEAAAEYHSLGLGDGRDPAQLLQADEQIRASVTGMT